MPFSFSTACINAGLNAIETAIGASAVLKLRSGAMPANVAAADSGTVLATITLPADWMAGASNREKLLSGTWSGTGSAAGTVGHFRIYASDGTTAHIQGTVVAGTDPTDGQLVLSNINITSGQPVSISAFSIAESVASALAGEIILSGTTFTATQLTTGLLGFFEYGVAGYIRFAAAGSGVLAFEFTGTGFSIAAFQGAASQPTDMVEVSVDGGGFTTMGAASSGVYSRTGLANTAHTIVVRINGAYGDGSGIATTGTVLTIIGGTSISLPRNSQHVTTGLGATIMKTASLVDTAFITYDVRIPTGIQSPGKIVRGPAESGKRNNWSTKIRTNATTLWIYTEDTFCWVHDGTTITRYNCNGTGITGEVAGLSKITGLSGLKNYSIWGSGRYNTTIGVYDGDFFTIPTTGVIHEFGDSIAEGVSEGIVGNFGLASVFQTAVGLGRIGCNFGISGNTIVNLKARVDSILANVEVTSFDVALLSIGRNNSDAPLDATEIADYQYIVSALRTKGYGRIICRGVLYEGGVSVVNSDISAIVTGFADAKIKYYNVDSYTALSKHDGVHLDATGMGQLSAFQIADLPALIGTLS